MYIDICIYIYACVCVYIHTQADQIAREILNDTCITFVYACAFTHTQRVYMYINIHTGESDSAGDAKRHMYHIYICMRICTHTTCIYI